MKKVLLLLLISLVAHSVHAQSKLTKESVVGDWTISAMQVPGMLYYSVDRDSVAMSDSLKKVVEKTGMDSKTLETIMKQQFAAFVTISFVFEADGKAVFKMGLEQPQESRYTVDEANGTITTTEKGQSETFKAEIVNGLLKLRMPEEQQEVWVILRKRK